MCCFVLLVALCLFLVIFTYIMSVSENCVQVLQAFFNFSTNFVYFCFCLYFVHNSHMFICGPFIQFVVTSCPFFCHNVSVFSHFVSIFSSIVSIFRRFWLFCISFESSFWHFISLGSFCLSLWSFLTELFQIININSQRLVPMDPVTSQTPWSVPQFSGLVWRWNQNSLSHMKDEFWHKNSRGCHHLPKSSVSYFVCRTASTPGNNPEVSTSEEVSVQFVLSYFSFEKTGHLAFGATWKSEPVQREWGSFVWWGRRGRDLGGVGGLLFVYICVCVESFVGGHPSCQSCLAGISGLFVELTHRYNGRFVSMVRPHLPPSNSRTWCQWVENTPRCKHTLES